MEDVNKNTGQGIGVAALVMGIISFVVAFIPCIGILALLTAIIAIILGAVGISQASRDGSPRGMMLGGLIVGIIALFVSITQIVIIAGLSDNAEYFGKKIENIVKDIEKDFMKEFECGDFKITIEEGDESIEIQGSARKRDQIDKLEKLEGVEEKTVEVDTTGGE